MAEIKDLSVQPEEENDLYLKFKRTFHWEDNDYEGVDLSGMETLTGDDLCQIHKQFDRLGIPATIKEQNPSFAAIVASRVTGLPDAFFSALPAKELNNIKNMVFAHFFTED